MSDGERSALPVTSSSHPLRVARRERVCGGDYPNSGIIRHGSSTRSAEAARIQKKSKTGIATPKPDMDLIRERLKVAARRAKELKDEQA
jgi:hypothetical protein